MTTPGHRERTLRALNHEETDRVPIDLSNMHVAAYRGLVRHLHLEKIAVPLESDSLRSHMATPPEAVYQALDVDVRHVGLGQPDLTPYKTLDEDSYLDDWGVVWSRAGKEHPFINKRGPFQETEPTLAQVEKLPWPNPRDPGRVKGLREKVLKLRRETDCAIVLGLPYCVLREGQRIRGFAEFMGDLLANPPVAQAIMERSLEVSIGIAEAGLEAVGDLVDVVMFPEDMGTQEQLFMRPEMYRRVLKPLHRRMVEAIKRKTKAKVLLHTDGAVHDIIGDFIEIGIEALNPIQVSAKGLGDTKKLKAEFGKQLTFWGAIDTHRVLPFGTPEDVSKEVKRRIDDLAPGGGFVLMAVHTVMAEVPAANIAAMLDTARSYHPHQQ